MTFHLSGIDEAGYGPLLGPLVVGLATLRTTDRISPAMPWKLLAPTVVRRKSSKRGLAIADSKVLHKGEDLTPLESGVLAFVAAELGAAPPATFRELIDHLTAGRSGYLDDYPWYKDNDLPLPHSTPRLELTGIRRRLERALAKQQIEVAEVRAVPLEVTEFNQHLNEQDSKGDVNAWAIGRFLRWLWRQRSRTDADVWVDRLGGRNRYGPFLYPLFPKAQFQIIEQGEESQSYEVENSSGDRKLRVHFSKECEEISFATALASMTAKYTRQLHLALFNRWWQEQHPSELTPTAGYWQDAKRFLADIEPLRKSLQISDQILVRKR
ncbi:MAG: hypothetical protein AAF581_11715 [Planctomycetota bacterium]